MRTRSLLLPALLALAAPAAAQQADGYTFHQDGRVLARHTFPGAVPAGASGRALPLRDVDLGTLLSLDPAIRITGAHLGSGPGVDQALRRAVGRELRWLRDHDTLRATVISADPLRVRHADGSVSFGAPGTPLLPADLVGSDAELMVGLQAERQRPALPLAWYADGGGWQVTYAVMLDQQFRARVSGLATVQTGSIEADSATVQLLAGNIGYEGRQPRPMLRRGAYEVSEMTVAAASPAEESVGEAHLYTLPGRHPLERNAQLAVALFEPATVQASKRFTVTGAVPMYGPMHPMGDEAQPLPVMITYDLPRATGSSFGDLPLPGGTWRLFQPDAAGRPQLVGVAGTGHTAAGQAVRLQAGTAFDLSARLLQENYAQSRDGRATIATADYRVTLANAGREAVTIDVLEQRGGQWTVVSSSVPAEKLSSTVSRFQVAVPAGGETVLTYRIEARW